MSVRNHYDVLGISRKASHDEVKAAFRKLSFDHHPDVAQNSDGEAFKAISEAHSILSNPSKRRMYDSQLQEGVMWKPGKRPGHGGDWYGGDNIRRPPGRTPKRGLHLALETLDNPRFLLFGVATLGVAFTLASMVGGTSREPDSLQSELVEAWKNPETGQWEQPAPWDPLYRKLKPTLHSVPREKVRKRHI